MVTRQKKTKGEAIERDDWSLTAAQMLFMMPRHNAILAAYERDDTNTLKALAGGLSQSWW
jgi:hypothetical protein